MHDKLLLSHRKSSPPDVFPEFLIGNRKNMVDFLKLKSSTTTIRNDWFHDGKSSKIIICVQMFIIIKFIE